jgi:TetR/AcrR family transcriptional repressor of nem operon
MKKSKAETAETRRRIVKSAAEEFRRSGIHATGLSEIMAAAGLTQGGFYRHFDSKAQLVAEACAQGMDALVTTTEAAAGPDQPKTGLEMIVENYLGLDHRDNLLEGCPLVGLGSEIARADSGTRGAVSDGFMKLVDLIARQMSPADPDAARGDALFALSAMIGALTMSRIVTDADLSAVILEETRKHIAGMERR